MAAIREDGTCTVYAPSFMPYNLWLEPAEAGDLDTSKPGMEGDVFPAAGGGKARGAEGGKCEMEHAYGLKPEVLAEIVALARRFGVQRLILFGSRSKDTYSRASDIDLAVCGGDAAGFALEAEETVPTLLRFDVVDMSRSLSPAFREEIEKGVVLYEKV